MGKSFEVMETIDAPAEVVWQVLTDADRYEEWNEAVLSIEGPIREGERLRLVSSANPKRAFRPRVVAMDAPHRMVWADGMPLGLFRGKRVFTLGDAGPGRTTFHMREEFSGPLAGLIGKSIPDLQPSFALFAAGLRGAAERSRRDMAAPLG